MAARTGTLGHHATSRATINRWGLWLFILSESFLFAALLTSRYYLQGVSRPPEVNQLLGLGLTVILLLSSLTAYRAEAFAAHGNQKGFSRNMLATIGMGLVFIVGVGVEWQQAFHHFPPSSGYGTILFTTTGIHAFHVITGVIALTVALFMGRRGRITPDSHWGAEGTVKYWHFVDLAWVFIYPTLYLVN